MTTLFNTIRTDIADTVARFPLTENEIISLYAKAYKAIPADQNDAMIRTTENARASDISVKVPYATSRKKHSITEVISTLATLGHTAFGFYGHEIRVPLAGMMSVYVDGQDTIHTKRNVEEIFNAIDFTKQINLYYADSTTQVVYEMPIYLPVEGGQEFILTDIFEGALENYHASIKEQE